jgi:hypothetical protein
MQTKLYRNHGNEVWLNHLLSHNCISLYEALQSNDALSPTTPHIALNCQYTSSAWNFVLILSGPTGQAHLIKGLILSRDFQIFFWRDEFVLFL